LAAAEDYLRQAKAPSTLRAYAAHGTRNDGPISLDVSYFLTLQKLMNTLFSTRAASRFELCAGMAFSTILSPRRQHRAAHAPWPKSHTCRSTQ
jgi:hypothetical protein